MINRLLPLLLLVSLCTGLQAQEVFWRDVSVAPGTGRTTDDAVRIDNFRAVSVNFSSFKDLLHSAPEEQAIYTSQGEPLELVFPLPGDQTESFRVYRAPVMMPRLAAKYPNIQSFRLIGTERSNSYGRLAYGVNGLSVVLKTRSGEVFMDVLEQGQDELYRVYFGRDAQIEDVSAAKMLACGYHPDEAQQEDLITDEWEAEHPVFNGRGGSASEQMRMYTMALACTGEYAVKHGGTVESVLSSYNEALSQLNQIYENEVSMQFVLIEGAERLIWTDPDTDPFANADEGIALLSQIGTAITDDAKMTLGSFDVGHVFTGNCTDVGGVASLGKACNVGREQGVTCHSSSNVPLMVRRIMAHEVGHQFSANHSFTNCQGNQGAVSSGKAIEPGSGSTIMSYAGLCGTQNVSSDNDAYFHVQSLEEIISYTRGGVGAGCASRIEVSNTFPEVYIDYPQGMSIPIGTPFQLEGRASDAEDDETLTYCWEEFDLGPLSSIGNPEGNTPIFRSFPPTTSPVRIFPNIASIVSGTFDRNEVLPEYTRDLNFRLTVRDNHEGGGAVSWKEIDFQATDKAGPFKVVSPGTDKPTWEAGTYREVSWDVANTDRAPVSCHWVNILLSVDGGFTYPYVLATGLPNNGSAMVPVPNVSTNVARVKVEANDHVFFNISSQNFPIKSATEPRFTVQALQSKDEVCLPDEVTFGLQTSAFLNYAESIQFDVVDGLPEGGNFSFSPEQVAPGNATNLTIQLQDMNNSGRYPVTVRAYAPGKDTIDQTIYLDVISNDFSDLSLIRPMDGATGIGLTTNFTWNTSDNADAYVVELATSPTFADPYLLAQDVLANEVTSYVPGVLLEKNTLHYWRLKPINTCGDGDYLPVRTFHTETLVCNQFESEDTPVAIPGSGLPTKESVITVDFDGIISDVNIPLVKGNYQPVNSLRITLISPSGTKVILFDGNCGNTTDLKLGFDDEAPDEIACPPDDGVVFQPVDSLAALIGESTKGEWTLQVKVVEAGFGGVGSIGSWQLEFCAQSIPKFPQLVTNDTLFVPPGEANPVSAEVLEVLDEDNPPDQLTYTLVQIPKAGKLYFKDQLLEVGDQFRQSTINAFNLYYLNEDTEATLDAFIFVVEDGTGGWISPKTFTIKVDDNATVGTEEPEVLAGTRLFPNPANSQFLLRLPEALTAPARLNLFDTQGRMVREELLSAGELERELQVSDLARGIYFLRLQTGDGVLTRRVVLQ
ncbi:MAG: M12 family metallo-peptidase [Saprospiraceae bacterium]|nr:T9SS type A sorting domain-containing protein [Lewinella sp.]